MVHCVSQTTQVNEGNNVPHYVLADEKARREELERGVEYLKRQVAALQGRIEALEQSLRQ